VGQRTSEPGMGKPLLRRLVVGASVAVSGLPAALNARYAVHRLASGCTHVYLRSTVRSVNGGTCTGFGFHAVRECFRAFLACNIMSTFISGRACA
jgi:hypothetical protein